MSYYFRKLKKFTAKIHPVSALKFEKTMTVTVYVKIVKKKIEITVITFDKLVRWFIMN